jgi:hypothetical protein
MCECVFRDILVNSGVPQGSHLGPLCFIWFVNEISRIFRHVRVLSMLYDDMKLFLPVRGCRDEWYEANASELNVISKCKSIMISRLRYPIEFSYMLSGIILDRVDSTMT